MPRVVHFEIHAADPERAVTFYRETFGWDFKKWEGPMPYWLVMTGGPADGSRMKGKESDGIDGGLVVRQGPPPQEGAPVNAYVCTVDVPDIDDYIGRATRNGATMAVEKMPIPGVGWLAYCKDTEGNLFGMMQTDDKAAPPA